MNHNYLYQIRGERDILMQARDAVSSYRFSQDKKADVRKMDEEDIKVCLGCDKKNCKGTVSCMRRRRRELEREGRL